MSEKQVNFTALCCVFTRSVESARNLKCVKKIERNIFEVQMLSWEFNELNVVDFLNGGKRSEREFAWAIADGVKRASSSKYQEVGSFSFILQATAYLCLLLSYIIAKANMHSLMRSLWHSSTLKGVKEKKTNSGKSSWNQFALTSMINKLKVLLASHVELRDLDVLFVAY